MLITFQSQKLTLKELRSGKIKENILSQNEKDVVRIINDWTNGSKAFEIQTSGSTGTPKSILLQREVLEYSAQATSNFLDPTNQFRTSLLCLNPNFIGGMMVVIRALINNHDLKVVIPSSTISDSGECDLVSLVPLQLYALLETNPRLLEHFHAVLIGGAPVRLEVVRQLQELPSTKCYHTYGMTETASHIALKNISANENSFRTLGDLEIDKDQDNCLKIRGTVTEGQWLQTNDVVNLIAKNQFEWLGRRDLVVNTGGIKVQPEQVEWALQDQFSCDYFVAGIPDSKFGQRLVLVLEGNTSFPTNFDSLPKYHRPKEVLTMTEFVRTQTGKIDRIKTLNKLLNEH